MYRAIIPVRYFCNDRFVAIEIPFANDCLFGIILSQDWKTMDIVDYGPNNVPKLLCGELRDMIKSMKRRIVDITIPLFSQARDEVSLVLRNGSTMYRKRVQNTAKVVANRVFLFYVRNKTGILLVGDHQGVD